MVIVAHTKFTVDTFTKGTMHNIMYGNTLTHVETFGYNNHLTRDVKFSMLIDTKEEVVEKLGKILAEECRYGNLVTIHYLIDGKPVPEAEPKMIYGPWGHTGVDV